METDLFYQLGKKIVFLRKKKKLSSLDLAILSGVNRNYLNDLENGRRNPTLRILRKIAIALDVDLSYLFEGVRDYTLSSEQVRIPSLK